MPFNGMGETLRPYTAKGQPFTQAEAPWLSPYLVTFLVSQSCRDEFCFLITVSAKPPLRWGLVKSPESLELGFSVLKSLIKFGIPGIRWGLARVKGRVLRIPGSSARLAGGQAGHFAPKHGQWVKTSLGAGRVRRRNVTCYWPTHSSSGFVEQVGDDFNFASPIVIRKVLWLWLWHQVWNEFFMFLHCDLGSHTLSLTPTHQTHFLL